MSDEIEEDYYLKYPEQEKLPEGYHETKLTVDLMIENKSLREQLAKLQKRDKQSVAKIIDLDGDILELKEQLAKEREFTRELLGTIAKLKEEIQTLGYYPGCLTLEIESLIKEL